MIGYEPEDDEKDDYKDLEGFKGLVVIIDEKVAFMVILRL